MKVLLNGLLASLAVGMFSWWFAFSYTEKAPWWYTFFLVFVFLLSLYMGYSDAKDSRDGIGALEGSLLMAGMTLVILVVFGGGGLWIAIQDGKSFVEAVKFAITAIAVVSLIWILPGILAGYVTGYLTTELYYMLQFPVLFVFANYFGMGRKVESRVHDLTSDARVFWVSGQVVVVSDEGGYIKPYYQFLYELVSELSKAIWSTSESERDRFYFLAMVMATCPLDLNPYRQIRELVLHMLDTRDDWRTSADETVWDQVLDQFGSSHIKAPWVLAEVYTKIFGY